MDAGILFIISSYHTHTQNLSIVIDDINEKRDEENMFSFYCQIEYLHEYDNKKIKEAENGREKIGVCSYCCSSG